MVNEATQAVAATARTIGQLEGRVSALEGWVSDLQKETREEIKGIGNTVKIMAEKVDNLAVVVSRGRGQLEGGLWTAVKLTGGAATLILLALTAIKVWHL